jgi:glycosyltransferase involved in cell wall biosynthesis
VANHPDTAEFFAHVVGDVPCWFVPNFLNFQGSSDYKSHVLNSTSLVMVGRLSSEKHHGFVIQSLQELKLRYPDIQLEILGDGDEESRLRKLSRDLGLADRVHFRGHVSDVASVVGRSQLLILASEFEGLPNVCLEAMDLGTPCLVSSNVSSMPRLFATGKHFLQFQHLDDNDFVEQCVRALEDPSYIQNVVDGARRAVHDLCSSDDVFATWLRIAI